MLAAIVDSCGCGENGQIRGGRHASNDLARDGQAKRFWTLHMLSKGFPRAFQGLSRPLFAAANPCLAANFATKKQFCGRIGVFASAYLCTILSIFGVEALEKGH
jgi:hypothetical protein